MRGSQSENHVTSDFSRDKLTELYLMATKFSRVLTFGGGSKRKCLCRHRLIVYLSFTSNLILQKFIKGD